MSSKRKPADFHSDPVRSELAQLINQAFYFTRRSFDEALRRLGLTAAQAGVLRRICDNPGITGVEISRRMFTTPQAAQLILATLENKGHIDRKPDPASGRIVRSFITEDGRRALDHATPKMWEVERELEGALTAEECHQLCTLLQRYVDG
jgi:DNA-binding MarR family transcriptional regulator